MRNGIASGSVIVRNRIASGVRNEIASGSVTEMRCFRINDSEKWDCFRIGDSEKLGLLQECETRLLQGQ